MRRMLSQIIKVLISMRIGFGYLILSMEQRFHLGLELCNAFSFNYKQKPYLGIVLTQKKSCGFLMERKSMGEKRWFKK